MRGWDVNEMLNDVYNALLYKWNDRNNQLTNYFSYS